MPALRVLRSLHQRQATPARLARLARPSSRQQQAWTTFGAQNMPPQRLIRPGQSQSRGLASLTGPTSTSGAPPPPPSAAAALCIPTATNPSTSQERPGNTVVIAPSPASRTVQIARHLSTPLPSSFTRSYTTSATTKMASPYKVRKIGAPNTLEHRVYIEKDGVPISPFHDIPLYANAEQTVLNMVVEIPRWTNAKLEVRETACSQSFPFVSRMRELTNGRMRLDLQGRAPQPHQAGYQEGQASLRAQLLPPQGLPVELWLLPSGMRSQLVDRRRQSQWHC